MAHFEPVWEGAHPLAHLDCQGQCGDVYKYKLVVMVVNLRLCRVKVAGTKWIIGCPSNSQGRRMDGQQGRAARLHG